MPLSAAVFTKVSLTSSRTEVVLSSTKKYLPAELPTQTSVADTISFSIFSTSSFHLEISNSKERNIFLSTVEENVLPTSIVASFSSSSSSSFSVQLTEPDGASARLSGSNSYSLAIIIACVFGAVAFLWIIILLIVLCLRCRKKSKPSVSIF